MKTLAGAAALIGLAGTLALPAHADDIRIGVIQGLSGAPVVVDFGESYLQGIEAAVKEYKAAGGKHNIQLIVYNDESNPQRAVQLAQRLIVNDKVPIAIGTVQSGNAAAFAPLFQEAKVPLMVGPAIATDITAKFINAKPSYVFRCSMVEKYQVEALLDWAVKNFKKIGLVHSTAGYGIFAAGEIKKGLAERGRELAAIEGVAPGVSEISPQMLKLKNAGVDLVLNFTEQFELPYKAMSKMGYKPVVAGNWGLSSDMMLNIIGKEGMEGTVMGQAIDLSNPRAIEFDKKMRAAYGAKYRWPAVAALGYDGARLMLIAIDKAGGNPAGIRDALEATDGFQAISGTPPKPYSSTDHECLDRRDVFLGVWRDGRVVKLAQ